MDTACTLEDSICKIPVATGRVTVIPDAQGDLRFKDYSGVWRSQDPVRFYAGAPLVTSLGVGIGAFCLIDSQPRESLTGEQEELLQQFADLVSELMELRRVERTSREVLDRALEEDEVTGWLSEQGLWRAFYRSGAQQVTRNPVAVVDAGIEQFNEFRAAYGSAARSRLLRTCADRLEDALSPAPSDLSLPSVPSASAAPADQGVLCAHYGDGHFVMAKIFKPDTPESEIKAWASGLANRVVQAFREPFDEGELTVHITARVGIVFDATGTAQPHEIVDDAHRPRGDASTPGVSRVVWSNSEARERQRSRFSLDHQLRRAIRVREFHMVYQPIMDLGENLEAVGVEALMRWRQPDGTIVPPSVFIPAAEELGLIGQIDRIAMELACEALARWQHSAPNLWVSVNASPQSLTSELTCLGRNDAAFPGLDPARMKLEITESALAGSD
jgi:predicted signal transduction protein with EAL and GGDEF domain